MSNITIPLLPPVIALNGTEFIEVVQAGTSSRATVSQIAAVLGTYTAGTGLTLSGNQFSVTPTGATAGTYTVPSFSVNAQGQITSITSGTTTGTGAVVLANSPTLVAPALGTPTSVTLTNAVGLPLSTGITGTLAFGNGGTGLTATPSNGQLLIGNGTGYSLATLTAGSNITITNTAGGITIASTAGGSGTVTSVNASGGTTGLSFSGGPVTTSGTLTLAGTLVVANGGTGATTSTGTGSVVLSNSPTLVNPTFNNTAQFTPNASTPTAATGLTYFSQGNDAFTVVNATGATEYMNRSVLIRVHNATGSTIAAGKVVYINGNYVGQYPTVALAQANSFSTIVAIGITNAAIVNNTNGYVTLSGLINGVDTSAYTAGTDLYLSPTTAGGLTSTVPSTPNYAVQIGVVTNSSTTGSMILVPVYLSVPATNVVGSNLVLGIQGTSQGTIQLYNTAGGAYSTTLASSNSATAAYTLTLPVNAGTNGYVLQTDGSGNTSWVAPGSGTVTSVNASGGTTGLSFSGGPITTSGTLTLSGTLAVANGGTGVTTSTGSGSSVLSNSPTLVTPALGVPSAITLTNATGLPLPTGVTGTLPVGNGGTGVTTTPANGALLIGNGSGYTSATLTAGSNITITNTAGGITIASTGGGGMVYPGAGIAVSTGSAWATSLSSTAPTFTTSVTSPSVVITSNSTTTTLQGSASATATTYTLPASAPGTNGYVLSSTTAGVMSWVAASAGTVTSVSGSGGTTGLTLTGGPITTSGTLTLGGTLAVANGGTGVTTSTGTGSVVLSNSPTLVTPALGTPSSVTLTNATGLPVSTGITGLGTGVATALGVNVGTAGSFVVNGGALGTPSSGTVTNLTGTASININGTVGATTPTTGAFTTATASTSITSPFYIANGTITSALTAGAYSYGTLGYSDTGIFSSYTLSQNSYNQMILQNSNSGTAASADFIVSNNNGTASTYYGDFGINSSGFTGSGSLNLANAVYLYSNSSDLVLGTSTSNAIHFVINGGTTDAVAIATTGKTTFQASSTTAASINLTPGTAPTSPVNGDMWSTSAGVYAQVNGSTVGPFGTGGGGGTLTVGTTATSGGAAGQIMFDTGSVLSESSSLTFASATRKLTVGGPINIAAGTSNSTVAWSTSGVNFVQSAATFTDNTTAASGTVTTAYMNLFGAQTYAAANTGIIVSNLYGTYFTAPLGGTNVTAANTYAIGADSIYSSGNASFAGATTSFTTSTATIAPSGAINLGSSSTSGTISIGLTTAASSTVNIANTALNSGYTKTVNIGTGATNTLSFTNINVGPTTSGSSVIYVGQCTQGDTVYIAGGSTSSGFSNTVNIATAGATGSTSAINIGTGSGSPTIVIGSTAATGSITINGSIKPLTKATTSGSTITPTAGTTNQYNVTALAVSATIAAPSGTPVDGQRLTIRFKDNGTAQTLTWTTTSGAYRAVGVTLPTTTVISKVLYVGCIYNSQDSFWDVVAVAQQ